MEAFEAVKQMKFGSPIQKTKATENIEYGNVSNSRDLRMVC